LWSWDWFRWWFWRGLCGGGGFKTGI